MERFIKTVADGLDRRAFVRSLGKFGMAAGAVAGVLLLPRRANADACPNECHSGHSKQDEYPANNPCEGLRPGDACHTARGGGRGAQPGNQPPKICVQNETCSCDCLAV